MTVNAQLSFSFEAAVGYCAGSYYVAGRFQVEPQIVEADAPFAIDAKQLDRPCVFLPKRSLVAH
jgi:hypothetical protein